MLRSLTLLSLIGYLVSLAATQTVYGPSFSMMRWYSLFALTGFGGLFWLTSGQRLLWLQSVSLRVGIYLGLWGLTVVNADYPLFSSYRWGAHAMIVVSALIFLPRVIRLVDAPKALLVLKVIVAAVLVASYFRPAPLTSFDDPDWYRGVFGNANALGEMAAVGCLLFLHGFLTRRGTRWRYLQAILAGLAAILIVDSAGRSSVVAFLAGFGALYILYRRQIPRYAVFGAAGILIAVVAFPALQQNIDSFIIKHPEEYQSRDILTTLTASHLGVWESSWEGFKERPLLGWGFGEDSSSDLSAWNGELTELGYAHRDQVNDALYSLETGGIIGLIAYLSVMALIFQAWVPVRLRARLDVSLYRRGYERFASAYDVQKLCCCTTVLLIVLCECDNTAFSSGNFFSCLLWLGLGQALGLGQLVTRPLQVTSVPPSTPRIYGEVPAE